MSISIEGNIKNWGINMDPSEKIIAYHSKNCPNIDIGSEEFTDFLLTKISELKKLQGA